MLFTQTHTGTMPHSHTNVPKHSHTQSVGENLLIITLAFLDDRWSGGGNFGGMADGDEFL